MNDDPAAALAIEHSEKPHEPQVAPVLGCPSCTEWRAVHRCFGGGSSGVVIPPKSNDEP